MAHARHPWWILGSVAVMLHGGTPGQIGDIDVLLDRRDCASVFDRLGLTVKAGQADARFRSDIFHRWTGSLMPVELFAGFSVRDAGRWHEYIPRTRIAVMVQAETVFVPDRAELVALLRRFGRPKDLERAALLT
ncbi:MAG: hypothetical protein J0M19_12145 [Sphingomonadales bacterium]|nr:hypothetical protein [Sphingomonadales bacterium]